MILVGIDLETTSADRDTCEITEFAMVSYHTEFKRLVHSFSMIIEGPQKTTLEAQRINGITDELRSKIGSHPKLIYEVIENTIRSKDVVFFGHNIRNFDWPILKRHLKNHGIHTIVDPEIIDTMTDIDYPFETRKLGYLASEYGFINPFPHAGIADILTSLQILLKQDVEAVRQIAKEPFQEVVARVGFEQRDLAKKEGFGWDPTRKVWVKNMRASKIKDLETRKPFAFSVKEAVLL